MDRRALILGFFIIAVFGGMIRMSDPVNSAFSTFPIDILYVNQELYYKNQTLPNYFKTNAANFTGPTGSQGPRGYNVTQGIQGIQGIQGPRGYDGIQGEIGPQGLQGIQGYNGTQGIQGIRGYNGTQGIQGERGYNGTRGVQGTPGEQGIPGLKGDTGDTGSQGLKGDTGLTGPQGDPGTPGAKGDKGDIGLQGPVGDSSFDVYYYRHYGTTTYESWYTSPRAGTALAGTALAANRMYAMPFITPKAITIDQIGIYVSTLSTTTARLGIYNDGGNCYPGTLLLDAGTVDVTATGAKKIAINQVLGANKLYWLVIVCAATPAIYCIPVAAVINVLGTSSALGTAQNAGLYVSQTYGTLPSSFPASPTMITAAPIPAIFVRLSA